MSLGVSLMSLAVGSDEDFRHEFDGDFDEFDEFGGVFSVCSLSLETCLMSLGGAFDEFGRGFGAGAWR